MDENRQHKKVNLEIKREKNPGWWGTTVPGLIMKVNPPFYWLSPFVRGWGTEDKDVRYNGLHIGKPKSDLL